MAKKIQEETQVGIVLSRYIHSFIYRSVAVSVSAHCVKKIIPPNHLTSLDFFFGHPFKTTDIITGKEIPYKTTAIRGCRTTAKYAIEFDQPFSSFSIKFTPTGLYDLLGLEMSKFTDTDINCQQLELPFDIQQLYRQINQACTQEKRIEIVEENFLNVINCHSKKSRLADFFTYFDKTDNQRFFLSERQLQRLFKQEIGLSPKSFNNLQRFSNLLQTKKQQQHLSWTSLAHEFGYFDQAHLIKTFYSFLGISPSQFNINSYAI